jgi:hypothetical protein
MTRATPSNQRGRNITARELRARLAEQLGSFTRRVNDPGEVYSHDPEYLPNVFELHERCLAIQATWSEHERSLRLRPDWRALSVCWEEESTDIFGLRHKKVAQSD